MKSKLLLFIFLFASLALVFGITATAQEERDLFVDIEFPIVELGNCPSKGECAVFCENPEHYNTCGAWAEEHGFVEDEALRGEQGERNQFLSEGGPGGCQSQEECDTYCDDPAHIEECVNFALERGHITPEEADVQLRGGLGGCRTDEECEAYCAEHKEECVAFAVEAGDITPEEAEKIIRGGPGGCASPQACEAYCANPQNHDECLHFAVAEGNITPEEAARLKRSVAEETLGGLDVPRRFGPDIDTNIDRPDLNIDKERAHRILEEQGGGPGGCQDERECATYCDQPQNGEACLQFAIDNGLIPPGHVERLRKLMSAEGPGGCRGAECRDYCEQPGHELECLGFAEQQGFLPPEEVARARKFLEATASGGPGGCRGRECEAYCEDPAHREECFEFVKSSNVLPPHEIERLEKLQSLGKKVEAEGGPGGCRNERECKAYCTDPAHFDECAAFAVNEGFLSQDEAERSLREFINTDQFGHEGFGLGQFGPGDFPPDFKNIPPEHREQFEREFQSRFEKFKQFQDQFEGGAPPSGFPAPSDFPGSQDFPVGDDFPTPQDFPGPHDSFPTSGGDTKSRVTLTGNPSGTFTLKINDPEGLREFSFTPAEGSSFNGGLSCDSEYRSETAVFAQMKFPLDSFVLDCSGNKTEFTIPALGDFDNRMPPPPSIPGGEDMPDIPEGVETPDDFQNFKAPEGFELPEGISPEDFQQQFQEEYQQQFKEQHHEQYEQQNNTLYFHSPGRFFANALGILTKLHLGR